MLDSGRLYCHPVTISLESVAAFHLQLDFVGGIYSLRLLFNGCLYRTKYSRLQAQSFIFPLHCVCISRRRPSDLSLVLFGFRSVRICIYPMYCILDLGDVCGRRGRGCCSANSMFSCADLHVLILQNSVIVQEHQGVIKPKQNSPRQALIRDFDLPTQRHGRRRVRHRHLW